MRFPVCLLCLVLTLTISVVRAADAIPAVLIAGKAVAKDADLKVGTKLVGVYDKKAYLIEVRQVQSNGKVTILWVESGEESTDVDRETLYYFGTSADTRKSRTAALPEAFRAYDKNGDGQIGLYEWDRAKYAEFKLLDKNRDGFLTPQELGSKPVAGKTTPAAGSTPAASAPTGPVNLSTYGTKVNESFTFSVTGKSLGSLWGSGPYTVDSDLAVAAVHAGVLKDGATGTVTVTILAPMSQFTSSTANGITSVDWTQNSAGFSIR